MTIESASRLQRLGSQALLSLVGLPSLLLLATAALAAPTFQRNVDMKGFDYTNFDLPRPSARLCQDACLNDDRCRAWTFVRPNQFGPRATCWLKSKIPEGQASTCCDSGTR